MLVIKSNKLEKMFFCNLFLFLLISVLSPIFAEKETCLLESNIVTELEKLYNVKVLRANLSISYDIDDMYITTLPNTKTMEVKFHEASASFTGLIQQKKHIQPENISVNFQVEPIYVQRKRELIKNKDEIECKLVDSENFDLNLPGADDKSNMPEGIEATIIQLTEYCVQTVVCQQFATIIHNDLLLKLKYKNNNKYQSEQHNQSQTHETPVTTQLPLNISKQNVCCNVSLDSIYNPQTTINAMTDLGLSMLVSQIAADHNGIVMIPEIFENFTTANISFLPTGDFIASNGSFADLKTLQRVNNVVLTHDKQRFSVGFTLRLGKADVRFGSYSLRYGKLKLRGELSVNISGIALETNLALDLNSKPCKLDLVELKNREFGDVDVAVSGIGFLNRGASYIIKKIIQSKAFELFKEEISKRIKGFNCEKFRPQTW